MALVLCTGVDSSLLTTRRLILESAGHKVVTVTDEKSLLAACKEHKFEVAVVGKMLTQNMKRRIAALLRTHCPEVKILELYESDSGKSLDDADSWMLMPTDAPTDLADRVDELAAQGKKEKGNGAGA
jgi:CheY-like chemotaxis protein